MRDKHPVKLTIAIPTFNRGVYLAKLLNDLSSLSFGPECEVVVIDNASDDITPEVIDQYAEIPGFRFERNAFNLGIEGNIIRALSVARGEYVWLLSDHMQLEPRAVKHMLKNLDEVGDIQLGYIRIRDYGSAVGAGVPHTLSSLSDEQRARLVFFTGNISGLLVSTALVRKSIRSIYRMARYTYPHLGVYFELRGSDRIVEFHECSAFQRVDRRGYEISYDTFCSRFIEYPLLLCELKKKNPELNVAGCEVMIDEYSSALHWELLTRFVSLDRTLIFGDLMRCLALYRARYQLLFIGLWLGGVLPLRWRRRVALWCLKRFFPEKYEKTRALIL